MRSACVGTRARVTVRRIMRLVGSIALLFVLAAPSVADAKSKRLNIRTTPPGAEIYLDDVAKKPIGVTPARVTIPFGFHEVILLLDGYETVRVKLNVDANTKTIDRTLARLARLKIAAASSASAGATVTVDGRDVGEVPYQGFMVPGRHQVTITKDGYAAFSDWVELRSGEVFGLSVNLQAAASDTGTLFVAADVDGATVKIDGVERGSAPLTLALPAGPVLVEVAKPGMPVWSQTVEVAAGKKAIARALLRPKSGPSGALLVIASVAGTIVEVDGVKTGTAPVTLAGIAPGTHVVEGYRRGYERAQQTVRIVADEQSVVKLDLEVAKERFGKLAVRSSVPGAIVYVDGSSRGRAPVELSNVPLGAHAIIVRKSGFADYQQTCDVTELEPCRVMAELVPLAKVLVTASPMKGRVSIDGKDVGRVPYEGLVAAETHVIRVEAINYEPAEKTVQLVRSEEPRRIHFDLEPTSSSTMAIALREADAFARRKLEYDGATTYTGVPLGPGMNTIDFIVGVPYLLEVRGATGIVDDLAGSVAVRFLERDAGLGAAELAFAGHTGVRLVRALSVGAQAEVFGGTDFSKVVDFGLSLRGLVTLHFGGFGAFTVLLGGAMTHDRWKELPGLELDGSLDGDQTALRLFTGARITWWASDAWAIFGAFDYTLAAEDRRLLREVLFGALEDTPRVAIHLGATYAY